MENKIKQVLINNMELFDENTGLMGIPDINEKLEIIAQEIVKLFAIPDVMAMLPTDDAIEANGIEGGLKDGELQMYWEGAVWLKNYLRNRLLSKGN